MGCVKICLLWSNMGIWIMEKGLILQNYSQIIMECFQYYIREM